MVIRMGHQNSGSMMLLRNFINRLVVSIIISTASLITPDLLAQVEEFDLLGETPTTVEKVNYAFKTTKVINLQSL